MASRLGQSVSKTAGHVGCSRYLVVIYQMWSLDGQTVNQGQVEGCPRLINAHGE